MKIAGVGAYCGCFQCFSYGEWSAAANHVTFPSPPPFQLWSASDWQDQNAMQNMAALGLDGFPQLARLHKVGFSCAKDLPLDSMHAVFLNLAKDLVTKIWFKPVEKVDRRGETR